MHELRHDTRIEEYADVSVKFQSSPIARNLEGRVFPSHSLDVSLHGMRLELNAPVPIGALLELEVRLHNSRTRYRHVGDVIWAEEIDEEEDDEMPRNLHDVGIRFHAHANPQFSSWATAVSHL